MYMYMYMYIYLLVVACSIQSQLSIGQNLGLPTDQQYRPTHCGLDSKIGLAGNSAPTDQQYGMIQNQTRNSYMYGSL